VVGLLLGEALHELPPAAGEDVLAHDALVEVRLEVLEREREGDDVPVARRRDVAAHRLARGLGGLAAAGQEHGEAGGAGSTEHVPARTPVSHGPNVRGPARSARR
jgi:hypothetical protein